jgi:lysozyme family protein
MSDFDLALPKVLIHEGGYSNHPKDPGGATMKGVTQRVYDDYRKNIGQPPRPVKIIGDDEIRDIYKRRYWDMFKGDEMPLGIAYVVFDGAVNSGVGQSVKWLQRALQPGYTGPVDGLVGDGTIRAINETLNKAALIDRICDQRMAFLKALKIWPTFKTGWTRRVSDVRVQGKAWSSGVQGQHNFIDAADDVAIGEVETPKAVASNAAEAPPVAPGDAVGYGGGVAATISQAIGQLQALQGIPSVQQWIMYLTIAGVVVGAAGFAYRFWAARRKKEIKQVMA